MMLALAFCGGTTFPPGEIPPHPDAGATTAQGTETFAIDTLFLGEYDRTTKVPSSAAWKSYGYNIDGLVTTKDSTDGCTAAVKTNQVDGNDGIDNAFGDVVLPIYQVAASQQTPSDTSSAGLRAGLYTLQIQIDGLPDASSSVTGITVRAFRSLLAGVTAPAFDETTDWPVLASSLAGSDMTSAIWQTAGAYIADDGTFVASMPNDAVLFVPIRSDFVLPIHHATITFTRTVANHLDGGTIAGVIPTPDLISGAKRLAGELSPSLCGSAFDGIAQQLQQASDILSDGTNKSGVPCDTISVGIGFTATKIANPTQVVPDPTATTDPCTAPPPLGPCTINDVSGYTPEALRTSKSIPGACTSSDLQTFWDTCLGPNADATQCNGLVGPIEKCTSCIFSQPNDAAWGPIVATSTTWKFNVAGCVALADGSNCASSIAAAEGCESLACETCGYVGGESPVDREQCIQSADVGGCASWVNAECDFVAAGAGACRVNPTDEASFAAFANVFCGN